MPIDKEEVPNTDFLYMRIHKNDFQNGEIIPGAFRNLPKDIPDSGMSTDWDKFTDWLGTRSRGRQSPENYGIVSLQVGNVREIPEQTVEHTPKEDNPSHTDVFGIKETETRRKFIEICNILAKPSD